MNSRPLQLMQMLALAGASLLLGACASPPPAPGPTTPDLASALEAARTGYATLGTSIKAAGAQRGYNRAVREVALHLAEEEQPELGEKLAEQRVAFSYPETRLPLKRIHVVENAEGAGEIGVPVIIEYDTQSTPHHPPEGLLVAGTAVYQEGPPPREAEFSLVAGAEEIRLHGYSYPPAVDYAAPVNMIAERAHKFGRTGFSSMVRPERMEREPRIYLIDPYDPRKRILLMVHGLQSTPVAFADLVRELHGDAMFRRHYQIWQYHYATGTPVLVNALKLRTHLAEAQAVVDPVGRDFATRNIVVMGHSMGGLMSHTLVSSSGDRVWKSLFRVPFEELQGDPEQLQEYYHVMHFQRNPRVKRAIFMAAPHRGSPMSDSLVGFLGRIITRIPTPYAAGLNSLPRRNPDAMTPEGQAFYNGVPFSSIRTLSARSPALRALAELPVEVPFHSIMGQLRAGPKEEGSDGVVPYSSAHLPGAESELVVRGGHNIFNEPAARAEILRILRLEAGVD